MKCWDAVILLCTVRIHDAFQRLHPDLLQFQEEFLDPEVRWLLSLHPDTEFQEVAQRLRECSEREGGVSALLMESPASRVYRCQWFSQEFCTKLCEELHNFDQQGFSRKQPNSLNRKGAILKDLGMDGFFQEFCTRCVRPIARLVDLLLFVFSVPPSPHSLKPSIPPPIFGVGRSTGSSTLIMGAQDWMHTTHFLCV